MKKSTNKNQNTPDLFEGDKKPFVRREDVQKATAAKRKIAAASALKTEHAGYGHCRPYGIIRINSNTILVSHEALN